MTVNGPIPADAMGTTLVHEHVLVFGVGVGQVAQEQEELIARTKVMG